MRDMQRDRQRASEKRMRNASLTEGILSYGPRMFRMEGRGDADIAVSRVWGLVIAGLGALISSTQAVREISQRHAAQE